MNDALTRTPESAPQPSDPAPRPQAPGAVGDKIFANLSKILAILLVVMLGGITLSLILMSLPSLQKFGFSFIFNTEWNPVDEDFGAWPAIVGTVVSSALAMLFAVPLSFGAAVFITQIAPRWLSQILARLIELMAGIPSIIYGMWGLFVFAPFMAKHVEPPIMQLFTGVPVLGTIFGPPPIGIGVLTAGIILAIMVIPLITSVMRDVLDAVPPVMVEATYGLGATRWEVISRVMVPHGRTGMLGGVILGFGRALGETMAVTFVIGNAHHLFTSLFEPGTTISATIANEFTEATGTIYPAALMELGLILFVITIIVLTISRLLLREGKA